MFRIGASCKLCGISVLAIRSDPDDKGAPESEAQIIMNVFIGGDMEGITGVVHRDQLTPEGHGWQAARRLYTADINAAIMGVLDEHPDARIRVADGHGTMRNILIEELHEAAELVTGGANVRNRPLCQMEGIDDSFDLALLVGFHSKSGSGGLLHHTYVGVNIRNFLVNGKALGEIAINAMVLGSFGVPVGLVTGSSDLADEVKSDLAGHVEFVATKQTIGPTAAICLPAKRTAPLIREGARTAVRRFHAGELALPAVPADGFLMEVETYRREMTEQALLVPGVERSGECSFRARGARAADVFRTMWHGVVRGLDQESAWLS